MPEAATTTTTTAAAESRPFDAASAARLRSLARPGYSPKAVLKSVSAFEVVAIAMFLLLVGASVLVYSFWILPDQVRYVQLTNEVTANRQKIEEEQAKVVDPASVTSQYQEVRDSLDSFRGSVLRPKIEGKQAILDAIDKTVKETGVQWAGAVSFTTDEPVVADPSKQRVQRTESSHGVASYPALEMRFAITGTYPQLRSFISRFEGSNQFVVINSVQLASEAKREADDDGPRRPGAPRRAVTPAAVSAGPEGPLTLTIGMTTYFQPSAAQ